VGRNPADEGIKLADPKSDYNSPKIVQNSRMLPERLAVQRQASETREPTKGAKPLTRHGTPTAVVA